MSEAVAFPFETADDGFERYYAEKLWHWIPEVYRTLDAEPPDQGVLRAMIEVLAGQAAVLRRDIDRVWDDQSIELCDDWVVSYLGELVGAFPLNGFNARGNRQATAKAVYYQRRKGTLTVIQELIRDITGLEGVAVEAFRRLVRFPHRLDIDVIQSGRVTASPAGGLVDLRNPRVKGLTDTGFDEAAHFADVRRLRGPYGQYGLRKINLHLYPLRSFQVSLPTSVEIGPGRLTLDPSGRDVPLFQRGQTSDRAPDQIREVDLPDAILCRRFNATRHHLDAAALAVINDPALDSALAPLIGLTFRDAASFRRVIESRLTAPQIATFTARLLDATMTEASEKAVLWGDSLLLTVGAESTASALAPSAIVAADLSAWEQGLPLKPFIALAVDPATGRVIDGPARPQGQVFANNLHYGQFAPLGAGTYGRAGDLADEVDVTFDGGLGANDSFADPGPETIALPATLAGVYRFTSDRTYEPDLTIPTNRVYEIEDDTALEAADGNRPYLRFRPDAATLDITFHAADGRTPSLVIDGLWIGMMADAIQPEMQTPADVADGKPAAPITARLILDGDFSQVVLRNVTLDPGGERARNASNEAVAIPYLRLEIEGQVSRLDIARSITGPIAETNANPDLCNVGRIEICDSVVQALDPAEPAIRTRLGRVHLIRSTVLGSVEVAELHASESFVDGRIRVTDNQHGCFRYSATGSYQRSAVLPPQFEAVVVDDALPVHWLASRRFGDPRYAALSKTAPATITRGSAKGTEMGVFNARGTAILLDDLAHAVTQLMPVGQTPQYILEDDQE